MPNKEYSVEQMIANLREHEMFTSEQLEAD